MGSGLVDNDIQLQIMESEFLYAEKEHVIDLECSRSDSKETSDTNEVLGNTSTYASYHDHLSGIFEYFELQENNLCPETEAARISKSFQDPSEASQYEYPSCNFEKPSQALNEYKNKFVMQLCFPTLFPNGKCGFNPLGDEKRFHKYELAEFFAHLIKWHN